MKKSEDTGDNKTIKQNSVTEGNLLYAFIMFLLPLMAASILQQSYTIADGLILGNAIDQNALGAVSNVSPILDLCTLIQIGIAGGCSIMISHLFGAKRYDEVSKLITDIRRITVIVSLVIAVIAFLASGLILELIHTPGALMSGASMYLRITIAGVPFMALYTLQAGILRGMGDSNRPLGGIAVSSIVNIGLDLLFVIVLHLGIAGAAIATVSAEIMSAVYLYVKLEEKKRSLLLSRTCKKSNVRECIRLGMPQIVQSVVSSGGKVLLQNITNMLGDAVVIGVAVAFKIDSILLIPLMSIGIAVSVFTGQNIGAGRKDRVRECVKYGFIITVAMTLLISLALWKFGFPLFTLFGLGSEAAETGFRYILLCLPFYWIFGMQFVLNGYLNGGKHTTLTSGASLAGLGARIVFAYACSTVMGADALPLAEALSWIVAVVIDLGGLLYFRGREGTGED